MRLSCQRWGARSMSNKQKQPRKFAIGNWKMNGMRASLSQAAIIAQAARDLKNAETVLCLPSALLPLAVPFATHLGGQDCSPKLEGAFTGDQSAALLADIGANSVILGHSERRALHGETDALVAQKARAAWSVGLTAILCIGENADERGNGETLDVLTRQLEASVPEGATAANTIIAYEPVWAIGTGNAATLEDIEVAHLHIREYLKNRFAAGGRFTLLYGGSLKASNADEIFAVPNVDGGLVGGASLMADDFVPIMKALDAAKLAA